MRLSFPLLLMFALASYAVRRRPRRPVRRWMRFEPAQLLAHLEFLSHDLLEGRAPSTRGGELAAEYLAAQLALRRLRAGAADGTYFQHVAVVESVVDPSFTLRVGTGAPFKYLQDVVAFSGVQDAEGVAPTARWSSSATASWRRNTSGTTTRAWTSRARSRWSWSTIRRRPPTSRSSLPGRALTYYGRWTYKFEEAARQGAAGAILIHTDESATYPWQVVQTSWSGTQYSLPAQPGRPALQLKAWVTNAAATEIARRGRQGSRRRCGPALACAARKPVPLGIRASVHDRADRGAEALAERHRRAEGHRPHARPDLHRALRPLRDARAAARRQA